MAVFLLLDGADPVYVFSNMLSGSFGSKLAISETIVKTIPLLLCALAVALPAKAGLINIGAEGQLYAGAIGASFIALFLPWMPDLFMLPAMFIGAIILGMIWAFIPGFLKATLNVNEIIITLLLNYVAIFWVQYLVHGPWKDPSSQGWPLTPKFPESAILPTIPGTRIHLMLLTGLILVFSLYFLLSRTTWGFSLRIIESNSNAARYAGINISVYVIVIFCIGGALAGLSGLGEVSAIQGRLRDGISPGYGYTGFLVSWLARNNFLAIPFVALFMGAILSGGDNLQIFANLPAATVDVLQGILLLGVLFNEYWGKRDQFIIQKEVA